MRTDAEKMAFAKECLKIEKQGGNVQEYIAQNWPSYTPRATWYNLQKQYLCRNVNQLTEGKPKTERKEVKNMTKRRDRNVVFDEIVKIIEAHGDPVAWFEENGYSFPITGWQDLKKWARIHRPDEVHKLPENLRRYYSENGIKRVYKTRDEKKSGENPTEDVKAPETVVMDGKEYEKMGGTIKAGGLALPPFDTSSYENEMIAPAYLRNPVKPSGPIKWDDNGDMNGAPYEIAMEKLSIKEEPIKKLKLRTLQGEMGTYEKLADDRMLFTGSPRPFTDCGYTVAEWFVLIEELQIAMQQLGLLSK